MFPLVMARVVFGVPFFLGSAFRAVVALSLPVVPLLPDRLLPHGVGLLGQIGHVELLRALDAPTVDPVERSERPPAAVLALAALTE